MSELVALTGHAEVTPITTVCGDLRKPRDVIKATEGVDCVIHTAAMVSVGTCPDHSGMEEINVKGEQILKSVKSVVGVM